MVAAAALENPCPHPRPQLRRPAPPPSGDPAAWWAARSRVVLVSAPDDGAPGRGRSPHSYIGIDHQPDDYVVQAGHVAEHHGAARQEKHRGEEEEEQCR